MRNKKCMGFLIITLVLVVSMFSNVFASNYGYWYSTSNPNNTISSVTGLSLTATYGRTVSCSYKSSFDVEAGDNIELVMETIMSGDAEKIQSSASACYASLVAEDGTKLCEVKYELRGNSTSNYGVSRTIITDKTAGSLTLNVSIEEPGERNVSVNLESLCVEINGSEV